MVLGVPDLVIANTTTNLNSRYMQLHVVKKKGRYLISLFRQKKYFTGDMDFK
jgi:hypothetical protein